MVVILAASVTETTDCHPARVRSMNNQVDIFSQSKSRESCEIYVKMYLQIQIHLIILQICLIMMNMCYHIANTSYYVL